MLTIYSDGLYWWMIVLLYAAGFSFLLGIAYAAVQTMRSATGQPASRCTWQEMLSALTGAFLGAWFCDFLLLRSYRGDYATLLITLSFFGGGLLGVYVWYRVTGVVQ